MPDPSEQQHNRHVVGLGSAAMSGAILFVLGWVTGAGFVTSHNVQLEIHSKREAERDEAKEMRENLHLLQLQLNRLQGVSDERNRTKSDSRGIPVPERDHLPDRTAIEDPGGRDAGE